MNNLSYLLYLANTLPSLGVLLVILSVVLFIISGFIYCHAFFDLDYKDENYIKFSKLGAKGLKISLVMMILTCFIPKDSNVYYAIAASEVGEEVLKSPVATKTGKAIEKWIDSQLEEPSNQIN